MITLQRDAAVSVKQHGEQLRLVGTSDDEMEQLLRVMTGQRAVAPSVQRIQTITRKTNETAILVAVNLDKTHFKVGI